jgi:LuxR family maltose regulon positive regulatory protein
VPLDDERIWYRYHHLFADLLRAQLQRSLGAQGIAQLHVRAADWHAQNGSILEAIHHASVASDDERVERFIEQNYLELVSHGEQSSIRLWIGKLDKELVYSRPWLCIYEAYSHSWFGELDKADRLLQEVEKRIPSAVPDPDTRSIQAHLAYIKSRVTAMRGNIHQAIEFCLAARETVPAGNLALQFDTLITLGYEYFLSGDYTKASQILGDMIRSGTATGAVINTVAASCVMARLYAVQGLLHKSYDTFQAAAQLIPEEGGQYLGPKALVEVGLADVLYEWDDLDAALAHIEQGLDLMPWWNKADDLILAYVTLARIRLAQASESAAVQAVEKAIKITQTRGVFSEARTAAEIAQVKLWLALDDLQAAGRWVASREAHSGTQDRFQFENELTHITRARVLIALNKPRKALALLSHLKEAAQSAGRMGRVIEILLLEALAMQEIGDSEQAIPALTKCLTLAEPEGYARVFLDEGQPMQMLLAQWLVRAGTGPLQNYATHLLSQFDAEPQVITASQKITYPVGDPLASPGVSSVKPSGHALVEPLSRRELEVLHLIALGRTNEDIAHQLVVARGTIKAHASHIYRKLDVANRTEAVTRARQLGLLP